MLAPIAAEAGLDPRAELERRRRSTTHRGCGTAATGATDRVARRLAHLLDPLSDLPFAPLLGGAAGHARPATRVGFGAIDGRPVAYVASDPDGALDSPAVERRDAAWERIVAASALPIFALLDDGSPDRVASPAPPLARSRGGRLGRRRALPRRGAVLAAVLGPHRAPWRVAEADVTVMTRDADLSWSELTGAAASRPAGGSEPGCAPGGGETSRVSAGAELHANRSGQIDAVVDDEISACAFLRRAFGYLPASPWDEPPVVRCGDPADRIDPELRRLVPEDPARTFDIHGVVERVVDDGSLLELARDFARNLVAGLARIDGCAVAVIANQSRYLAGALDVDAVIKIRHVLEACAAFRLPLVSFLDVPGVLPSAAEEGRRLLSHLHALAVERERLEVARVAVVVRRAYGFGLSAMSGADPDGFCFAWPSAEIAVTGPEARPRRGPRAWAAARAGYVDDVIDPARTREVLARVLAVARAPLVPAVSPARSRPPLSIHRRRPAPGE